MADDCLGLWEALTKRFTQLGKFSGSFFLRMTGNDTFMLSSDVGKVLNEWDGYDGKKGKIPCRGTGGDQCLGRREQAAAVPGEPYPRHER